VEKKTDDTPAKMMNCVAVNKSGDKGRNEEEMGWGERADGESFLPLRWEEGHVGISLHQARGY